MLAYLEAHSERHHNGATLPGERVRRLMSEEERAVFWA
jgi:hypothetical protein